MHCCLDYFCPAARELRTTWPFPPVAACCGVGPKCSEPSRGQYFAWHCALCPATHFRTNSELPFIELQCRRLHTQQHDAIPFALDVVCPTLHQATMYESDRRSRTVARVEPSVARALTPLPTKHSTTMMHLRHLSAHPAQYPAFCVSCIGAHARRTQLLLVC